MPLKLSHTLRYAMVILFTVFACEESVDKTSNINELTNTLSDPEVGNGITGALDEYFYDVTQAVDVSFYRYDITNFGLGYSQYRILFGEEPPVLSLKNFPDYLAEIHANETSYTQRTGIDTLPTTEIVIEDSVTISSIRFKDLEAIDWDYDTDLSLQRYKPVSSTWIFEDVVEYYSDTAQARYYQAVVDTPIINQGLLFVDQSEWVDTTYEYSASQIPFTHTFHFTRKQLSADSLIYRTNCDCNDNGVWDPAETGDVGNGIWDPAEPYYDINGNGTRDGGEPFEDRNCNGTWDDAEVLTVDANGNGVFDPGDVFVDEGNGIENEEAECYTDLNHNGMPDNNELFTWTSIPNNLLVTWTDSIHSQVLIHVAAGDSVRTRWGIVYPNVIETVDFTDEKTIFVDDMDSIVTLYTNEVIEYIPDAADGNYFIMKTEWGEGADRNYDYLLFKLDGHLYQVVHPTYFAPEGFLNNFWVSDDVVEEILYYTDNGRLRDGERVEEVYYDTTSVSIYKIEKTFSVAADTITVPGASQRGIPNNGAYSCLSDTTLSVTDMTDCPAVDTTFTDCFRITRELRMTMIGTGVEYGQRDISWLAKGRGLVQDELYIRWSESPLNNDGEAWFGISKWELGAFSATTSSGGNARWLNAMHTKKLDEFRSLPDSEDDPYMINHVAGFQRVDLPRD
ncbi:MAG: hypothetical protein ACE5D8_03435 [Fidelibacterota bacterium]